MALIESTQVAAEDFEVWLADLVESTQIAVESFENWGKERLRFVRQRRDRTPGDIQR